VLSNELRRHIGTASENGQEISMERCRMYVYIARRICLGETTFKTGIRFKWVHSLEDVVRSFGVTLPHLVVALALPLPFYGQTFRREYKQSVSCYSLRTYCTCWVELPRVFHEESPYHNRSGQVNFNIRVRNPVGINKGLRFP
jgi:hypothetical protein